MSHSERASPHHPTAPVDQASHWLGADPISPLASSESSLFPTMSSFEGAGGAIHSSEMRDIKNAVCERVNIEHAESQLSALPLATEHSKPAQFEVEVYIPKLRQGLFHSTLHICMCFASVFSLPYFFPGILCGRIVMLTVGPETLLGDTKLSIV